MGLLLAAVLASTLHVRVLDPSGALVVEARVVARDAAGAQAHALTDRTGEAVLTLAPGRYAVVVEAEGFEPAAVAGIAVGAEPARLDVPLRLARRKENLDVAARDDLNRGRHASNVLTEADIAALPDDPDEMEDALRHMAGPGAVLRVNGFGGGRLPPKSQIRQIRISMSAYAAEYHEGGAPRIDIVTKPGLGSWRRSGSLALREARLNAPDPLSGQRGPGDLRRFGLTLDGPLQVGKTSLSVAVEGRHTEDPHAVVATLPDGGATGLAARSLDRLEVASSLEHGFGTHTLRAEYQRNGRDEDGLGSGGLDLPERGYREDRAEHLMRIADTGVIGGRVAHQARLQLRWQDIGWTPRSLEPAVQVAGAFHGGGAGVGGSRRVAELEFADDVDWSLGPHAFRAGVLLEAGSRRSDEARNANGTFLFPSLDAYRQATPILYTRRDRAGLVSFGEWRLGVYAQDDVRLGQKVALHAGIRQERHSLAPGRYNLAPRGGLTWSPTASVTVRAGGGRFFDWLGSEVFEESVRLDGAREREWLIEAPAYPDPLAGGTSGPRPSARVQIDPGLHLAEVWRFEVGLERALGERGRVGAHYGLERGRHLYRARNLNPFSPGLARPDARFANVLQVESTAASTRQSLRVSAHAGQPMARFNLLGFYMLSKAIDETDGPLRLPADGRDPAAERGPARDDLRHRVFAMASLRPGRGLRLSALLRAESGSPYEITTGRDDNGDAVANDRPAGIGRNQGRGQGIVDLGLRGSWTVAFGERKTPATPGGPRLVRFDPSSDDAPPEMGLPGDEAKRFRVTVYAHAFNLLDRTNPTAFNGVFGAAAFGQPTASLPGRRVEVGASLGF
jgi:hypothetical protein